MLDLSGDTASDIQFRTDRHTCLADLAVMVTETGINGCTAGAYFGMKFLCQFEQHIETFLGTHSVTAGYYDRSTFQVVFGLFYVAVDDLYDIIRFRNIFGDVVFYHFAFITGVQNFFFHHTFANSRHLRTVFRIDDRRYDVTTESGTDLV